MMRAVIMKKALKNYFNALRAYEQAGSRKKQAGATKNIGNIYRVIRSYDKSKEFLDSALKKYKDIRDSTGISGVLNDMGLLYMEQDSTQRAIELFSKVIYTFQSYTRDDVKAFALNNLGITFSNSGSYRQALNCYTAALTAMQTLKDEYGTALILGNMASVNSRLGNYKKAIEYNRQALHISNSIGSDELLTSLYGNFADIFSNLHRYDSANEYLTKLMTVKDTIFEQEKAKNYLELETRYQNEKKSKEILQLKQENTIRNLDLANQRRTQYLLISGLIFVSVVVLLLYRNYRSKQRANKELNVLNGKLNEANRSKTKLFSIISHDLRGPVSSLFSFLELQKSNPSRFSAREQEEYNEQITASADNLLEAMEDLLIWSKSQMESFEPAAEQIEVSSFLDDIIHLNVPAATAKKVELVKKCDGNIKMDTDPNFLKIVLRNLTGNAIKFAPVSGVIILKACRTETEVLISIEDNGPGVADKQLHSMFEWNSIRSDSSGLGLKLAKEFTEKLNGKIAVSSAPEKGTVFTLTFPRKKAFYT